MASVSPATRYRPITEGAYRRRARVNRLNLTTPLGLAVARLGLATVAPGPDGLLLAEGYRPRLPKAGAFTIGNVVTTAHTFAELEAASPGVLGHESEHAWQYARLGLGFFPLYAAAASGSWLRYGDPAVGNVFEQRAGLVSGSYLASGLHTPPRRPIKDALGSLIRRSPTP
jgi:hypothetical protein